MFAVCALLLASEVLIQPGKVAVVVEDGACPVIRFAATELTNGLAQTLGVAVPVVSAPQAGRTNILIGDNRWSRAEKLDPLQVARDGFLQLAKGDRIYLVGADDPKHHPLECVDKLWLLLHLERGTLNAVYDFLERYAAARYFFPGELGTLFRRRDRLAVPEGLKTREPVFTERYFSNHALALNSTWFDPDVSPRKAVVLHWLRLRYGSAQKTCCHGQRYFNYVKRFGAAHPEWFCLKKNGERNLSDTDEPSHVKDSKLCYTSPICEEMYQDVKAFLTGQPASSRGLKRWGLNCVKDRTGNYVDIMPEDGFTPCHCPNCQAAYDKTRGDYATELIWKMTADIASRLQKEGVAGGVTQMAYSPYRDVPSCALPTNVDVMVAVHGPWSTLDEKRNAVQLKTVRGWAEKLGHKVWLWTYPGKFFTRMPDVPVISPRAYARFWKSVQPYAIGGFSQNGCERFMYEVLNFYVLSKVYWNPEISVDALIADWNARLFGEAKDEMAAVYDILETKWVGEIQRGHVVESAIGPVAVAPTPARLWGEVYTPQVIAGLRAHFDAAAKLVRPGSREARCVAVMRAELFEPLARQSVLADVSVELRRRARAKPVSLIPNGECDGTDGWRKSVGWGTLEADPNVKVTGCASLRLESDKEPHREKNVQSDASVTVSLSASKKYRLSYFIRVKDVVSYGWQTGAGLCLWFAGGKYRKHPEPLLQGTCDWIHRSVVFTPPVDSPECRLQFRLEDSLGTMWVDGVVLEEWTGGNQEEWKCL